jgi:antitoxin Phd
MIWQVQEAKAKFSELLATSLRDGPQVVSRSGREVAVVVPIDEWHRLKRACRPTLKELLLAPTPRFENIVPERGRFRRRTVEIE